MEAKIRRGGNRTLMLRLNTGDGFSASFSSRANNKSKFALSIMQEAANNSRTSPGYARRKTEISRGGAMMFTIITDTMRQHVNSLARATGKLISYSVCDVKWELKWCSRSTFNCGSFLRPRLTTDVNSLQIYLRWEAQRASMNSIREAMALISDSPDDKKRRKTATSSKFVRKAFKLNEILES